MSEIILMWVISRANAILRIIYIISTEYINIISSAVNNTHRDGGGDGETDDTK